MSPARACSLACTFARPCTDPEHLAPTEATGRASYSRAESAVHGLLLTTRAAHTHTGTRIRTPMHMHKHTKHIRSDQRAEFLPQGSYRSLCKADRQTHAHINTLTHIHSFLYFTALHKKIWEINDPKTTGIPNKLSASRYKGVLILHRPL